MRKQAALAVSTAVMIVAIAMRSSADQSAPSTVVPLDPITAILDAFRTHSIVALSDPHGGEQMHEFLLTLVRHPEFPNRANDLVVEPASARYQALIDRYIRGEEVAASALREAWQNSTQHQILDQPILEEFLRAVREVNAALPEARRLRVLLGDPPIDWDAVRGPADHRRWIEMREWFPAAVIQTEVIAKRRRALVMFGQMHLQRKNAIANYDMETWQAQTLVSAVERATGVRIFNIWGENDPARLQPEVKTWTKPGLVLLRGTSLGATDFEKFRSSPQRFRVVDEGKFVPIPKEEWRTSRMEDQFEALLFLGPRTAPAKQRPAPAACADTAYMQMRMRRLTLTGAPPPLVEQLRRPCNAPTP